MTKDHQICSIDFIRPDKGRFQVYYLYGLNFSKRVLGMLSSKIMRFIRVSPE